MVRNYIKLIKGICELNKLNIKCYEYFPLQTNKPIQTKLLEVSISKIIEKNDLYRETILEIRNKDNPEKIHIVRHFFIHSWVDMSVISKSKRILLMKLINFMTNTLNKFPKCPVVVHCSAGIGRTGTLIALYHLYQDYLNAKKENQNFKFSVYDTVIRLRHMRRFMVQTDSQYEFIFDFMLNFDKLT